MLSRKKTIFRCEEVIAPLTTDAEGKLLGGFSGISAIAVSNSVNGKCINGSCQNGTCANISCKNGDCTNGECINGECSDLPTSAPSSTPAPTMKYTITSFFM